MKKIISLIRVSLNHDMNLFKINTKKQSIFSKYILPIFLILYFMAVLGMYSNELIGMLRPLNLELFVLTFFALSVSIVTLMEGIYKSSTLLFNLKDDNLLLSLPINKRTVLFIRIFKFYVFELLYNSLFIIPAMIVYAIYVMPNGTYYLSSLVALFILPIIPVVLSSIIGFIIAFLSSKFKGKNLFQTLFSITLVLLILYFSFNKNILVNNILKNASNINDLITRLYYPVGAYVSLVNNFNILNLIKYIIMHIFILIIPFIILNKIYFSINSGFKKIIINHKKSTYNIKCNSKMKSFIKKELNKFFKTPVFITNTGFGLILFDFICILIFLKYNSFVKTIVDLNKNINLNNVSNFIPLIMFELICFTSFTTSITSSMISLEGKSINILKSLPIKPIKIVLYKILTALIIMVPCIIIGDIIIFIKFRFNIFNILIILLTSILLPFVSSIIGIIANLKYPKFDASNDTEVVKQSMSPVIALLIGLGILFSTTILFIKMLDIIANNNIIILIFFTLYLIIALILWIILKKICDKTFNNISV